MEKDNHYKAWFTLNMVAFGLAAVLVILMALPLVQLGATWATGNYVIRTYSLFELLGTDYLMRHYVNNFFWTILVLMIWQVIIFMLRIIGRDTGKAFFDDNFFRYIQFFLCIIVLFHIISLSSLVGEINRLNRGTTNQFWGFRFSFVGIIMTATLFCAVQFASAYFLKLTEEEKANSQTDEEESIAKSDESPPNVLSDI